MSPPIYLDNNATTPVDPRVLNAMLPFFSERFGNPSNTTHAFGTDAADALEDARTQVASAIGASAHEIVFTSGGTESNNLAILGVCRRSVGRCDHVVTTVIEHKAVLEACRQLEREGWKVTYLPVDPCGAVSADAVASAITPRTALVSVMAANNEVGTIQPVEDIGRACRDRGVPFHSDAVQAVGRIPVEVDKWNVDLLSFSSHKLYGPKGCGALYIRGGDGGPALEPMIVGGGQERGLRAGTPPVPLIVGFGVACNLGVESLAEESARIRDVRDDLARELRARVPDVVVHGDVDRQLPGLLSVAFPRVDGDVMMQLLTGVAASQGSSCRAGSFEPSHVLRAMGVSDELARATLRLGVGRFTRNQDVKTATALIAATVGRARAATG